jgi:hypothetical protein
MQNEGGDAVIVGGRIVLFDSSFAICAFRSRHC